MLRVAFRAGDKRLLARIIHAWDSADVSHCEVAVAFSGRAHDCISSSWLDGGVRRKVISLDPQKWRVYEMPEGFDADRVLSWLRAHGRQGYDWLGLIGFLIRPLRGFGRRQFCSEACADMLGIADPWRFSPRAFECVVARIARRVEIT